MDLGSLCSERDRSSDLIPISCAGYRSQLGDTKGCTDHLVLSGFGVETHPWQSHCGLPLSSTTDRRLLHSETTWHPCYCSSCDPVMVFLHCEPTDSDCETLAPTPINCRMYVRVATGRPGLWRENVLIMVSSPERSRGKDVLWGFDASVSISGPSQVLGPGTTVSS